ncbi:MAG: acetylglutamate kinase [Clostridiales bacterium]|nr:acetylglutamate kinase [Clostridiales bacterium]
MDIPVKTKAEILIQALPYMQKYYGKVVVVKYGGNAMVDAELKRAVMSDVILLSLVGIRVVLVHGGGPEITSMLKKLGIESKFVGGLRVTDEATSEVVQMVLAGKTNKDLVALVDQMGGRAIGICGIDGGMLRAQPADPELGYVGEVSSVDVRPIELALDNGYIPVVATVGMDADRHVMNVNADTAAAAIAGALGAENIVMMTDIRGLMRDMADPSSLIPEVTIGEVPGLIERGVVQGGMIPKVKCCADAVKLGVKRAVMIDGRIPHAILIEMFSDEGIGTMFYS